MESSSFGIFYQQLFLGESSPLWDGYRDCQTLRGKCKGPLEHRSVSSELVQTLTREVSLVEISFDILGLGIILGTIALGVWCYTRPSKMWYKHSNKKQKVLLVSSDLILGIVCWIVALCYWSQYLATLPWIFGFIFVVLLLFLFVGKILCSFDK